MSLKVKFTLWTFVLLAISVGGAGWLLSQRATEIASTATARRLADAVELTVKQGQQGNFEQKGDQATIVPGTDVRRFPIEYGLAEGERHPAEVYQARDGEGGQLLTLLVPDDSGQAGRGLLDLILVVTLIALGLGGVVSFIIANSVAAPIVSLVDDVRQIARGNLNHRTHVRVGGEVAALAREIDKMTASLNDAQEERLEHSARERELEVAEEVRKSLVPESTPEVAGYDLQALQISCPTPGGDFYDVLEYDDGRVGLLVCQVSGKGIPGALSGATARATLTSVLLQATSVSEGLNLVNRYIAPRSRRGMFVTALYALLEPSTGKVQLACAGHKVPLLRYSATEGKAHKHQPDGFAIGLDTGAVFESRLAIEEIQLDPGDRLVLANEGPVRVQNAEGVELGETGFYRLAMKRAKDSSDELLGVLDSALFAYAEEEEFPSDIAVITIRRDV
ncbi:MAG: serine phosphatase RsbU (regulator of sigma subunit) [Candidatus Paceibacteria bacterium]|jgi:serine phosphatase RsbU (regulator of sigma subunit)